jgi:excinuclease ABC subunit A
MGLPFSDLVRLLDCFEALLGVGHALIVIEHTPQVLRATDYLIDLGPGAGAEGGLVVVHNPPEAVAGDATSVTGRHLREVLPIVGLE